MVELDPGEFGVGAQDPAEDRLGLVEAAGAHVLLGLAEAGADGIGGRGVGGPEQEHCEGRGAGDYQEETEAQAVAPPGGQHSFTLPKEKGGDLS